MRIAFLNGYQNERGAETFVKELSDRLKGRHEVLVISGSRKNPKRWPFLWRLFLDPHGVYTFLFTFGNLFRIWKDKFDIVIPINGGWQPALVRLITWLYGGKMVISGQSGIGWDDKNNLWCFPNCFVALSSFAGKWAKKVNPFVKIINIPNGVDINKFKPDGEKLNLKLTKPVIITVGALTQSKRIDLVIKAVAKLKNTSLLVVGDGDLKRDLQDLGKEFLGNRFELISLPFSEMPIAYRTADLFTLVSESYYSFEIAIVEALATNLPVVVNSDSIRKEIIKDAGFLVDPTDISSFSKTISKALNTNWDDKPRKVALNFFWDKISGEYEKLFSDLVGEDKK
jgi:glycosyltransferase involved in cell wall biosynthesis